jgi:hypothetical protein
MAVVIDTNVWAVAAGITEQADEDCIEYFRRLPENSPQCRTLGQLIHRADRIEYRECHRDPSGEWPLPDCLAPLHHKDRKFAAVALTYDPPAPIYNAVDEGWRHCKDATDEAGLEVNELCPQCLR